MDEDMIIDEIDDMIETITHPGRIHGAGDGMLNLVWELANEQDEDNAEISPRQQLQTFEVGAGDSASNYPIDADFDSNDFDDEEEDEGEDEEDGDGEDEDEEQFFINIFPTLDNANGYFHLIFSSVRSLFHEMLESREALRGCNYAFILLAIGSGFLAGHYHYNTRNFF